MNYYNNARLERNNVFQHKYVFVYIIFIPWYVQKVLRFLLINDELAPFFPFENTPINTILIISYLTDFNEKKRFQGNIIKMR